MSLALEIFMYLSHLAFVPPIVLALRYVYPVDLWVFIRVAVYSLAHHATFNGHHMNGGLQTYQRLDHSSVWSTLLWLFIRTLDLDINVMVSIQFAVPMLFDLFPDMLIETWVFPLVMVPSAIVIYMIRLFLYGVPFPRISVILVGLAAVSGAAGMVFFHLTSGYGRTYLLFHPDWHICGGISFTCLYLAILGFRFDTYLFGIDRHWNDLLGKWEDALLGHYNRAFSAWGKKRRAPAP